MGHILIGVNILMSEQLPPADELFAVREKIKALELRETELRNLMLSDPAAHTGNRYVVVIKKITQQKTDWIEIKKMHPELVAGYTWPVTQERVELRGISEDGEILPLKRVKQ